MRDFEHSTLWRISAFDRLRASEPDGSPTLLPTTLLADLDQLQRDPANDDVLEVVAACLRHREPALLYLAHAPFVWPVTLFPQQWLYHSPHEATTLGDAGELAHLKLIVAERPGVRPPGHWMFERVAAVENYRPLRPLLWTLALQGPRRTLLGEIGGRAAYRLTSGGVGERPSTGGALASAMQRLRQDAASLRDIASWPGMSLERASRLLNALYLTGGLMVTRSHPAARDEPEQPRAPGGRH
ncbi:hypothetical protein HLB44_08730 [Aquincola sp. S2]|uniref:DNA-binding protein n=1 Tax=Pseudaquabacterium terrae TaxID=2732868 RepID=A0ABX2EEM4_9BURK|nr:hypothetical protein [Aquabacterium terrae]NRF67063.1 hypothetical protein [Aquabacterium terrae]